MNHSKPKLPPLKELVATGANAPLALVRYTVNRRGPAIAADATGRRTAPDFDVEAYVQELIASQLMLVRGQGALAGLAISAAEGAGAAETAASAGTGAGVAVAGTAAAILADVATLSYLQIELSLKVAAAYGHDLTDSETRAREILHLHGLEMAAGDSLMKPMGHGGERVGKTALDAPPTRTKPSGSEGVVPIRRRQVHAIGPDQGRSPRERSNRCRRRRPDHATDRA